MLFAENTCAHVEKFTPKKKLLVFELEQVLLDTTLYPRVVYTPMKRWGLHEFLALCFKNFDVGIWTSSSYERTKKIIGLTFTDEEISQFKFVKNAGDATTAYNYRVPNLDIEKPVLLKKLFTIWSEFSEYDESNTLLIDSHPYHAFANPTYTSLYMPRFPSKYPNSDDFLMHCLWPCLEQFAKACHTRIFLQHCEPRWSRNRAARSRNLYKDIYSELNNNHSRFIWITPLKRPEFSVLEWSEFELSWDMKEHISSIIAKIPPSIAHMSTKQVVDFAFELGFDFDKTYVMKNYKGFLRECRSVYLFTSKFKNLGSKDSCNRLENDKIGITCYNTYCTLVHK